VPRMVLTPFCDRKMAEADTALSDAAWASVRECHPTLAESRSV
jgi:hypothetical protein